MRIALVHDWLTGMRGGERVLEVLCALFPGATVFTLFHDRGSVSQRIESMPIRVSPLNRFSGIRRHYRYWLPLYPWAISRFDLSPFDLVISNSHAAAKGVRKPESGLHICCCLTPMRYVWDMGSDYFHYSGRLGAERAALAMMKYPLRAWDRATSVCVDHFVASSRHVQQRIACFYGRESEVIYPPVDTEYFFPSDNGSGPPFYLVVSALVPYKRIDIALDACRRLDRRLVIAGEGPDRARLERKAGPGTVFKGFVTDSELRELYRHCSAVIVPGREDFGLVSVEAQACGRPVIAYAAGGSLESVREGETGVLFHSQTTAGLMDALLRFEGRAFDQEALRLSALRFSTERFRSEMQSLVSRLWDEFSGDSKLHRERSAAVAGSQPAVAPAKREPNERPHPSLSGMAGAVKRALDIAGSVLGLGLLALPLGLIAWLIRRDSPGPGLYRQTRLGLRGREFEIIKLRTMRLDAEVGGNPVWARRDDPRCTRWGARLRRYGIDELPQLWNVLKGEMSLVGPRPERPGFHAAFMQCIPGFEHRLAVRAGITGRAQVQGWRGDTSVEERLRADLAYIDGWTMWKDVMLLIQTPLSVLRPPGRPASIRRAQLPVRLSRESKHPIRVGSGAS